MTRTVVKAKNKKTVTKITVRDQPPADLYKLIIDAAVFAEDEREFWLAQYEVLPVSAQHELVNSLRAVAKELKKENENHEKHLAEIYGKYETKFKRISKEHRLEKIEPAIASSDTENDLLDDELFAQLEQYDTN